MFHVVIAIRERTRLNFDGVPQRHAVELRIGEILEQNVDGAWRARWSLKLLRREDGLVSLDEGVELVTDDDADVLQPHLVGALVDRRDELD